MATVTADGTSFIIDNQRHWIVGGLVGYAGLPRETWRSRLLAAKYAGLNTVIVPIVWSEHQPTPGKYAFDHDQDIALFIQLAGSLDLKVIPRIGPVSAVDHALGGMPHWITNQIQDAETLRSDAPAFLDHAAKWFTALGKQLKALQATEATTAQQETPSPIIAIEIEHNWASGDPDLSERYLTKLQRYAREGGFTVPTISTNNLFAHADGDIEAWSGYANLHAVTRQLKSALKHQPALISDLQLARTPAWGEQDQQLKSADDCTATLAQVLAAGGQFMISDFAPAPRFGFRGARLEHQRGAFATSTNHNGSIIPDSTNASPNNPRAAAVRRICTFASSFARIFTAASSSPQPAILAPDAVYGTVVDERTGEREKPTSTVGPSIESCEGPAGTVIFIANNPPAKKATKFTIHLTDGTALPIEMKERTRWILTNTHLFSNKHLDFCTLSALAFVADTFVCFAPAGSSGTIQINGTPLSITAPRGKSPNVERFEGITVIVLNEEQASAVIVEDDAIVLNALSVDQDGNYISPTPTSKPERISSDMRRKDAEQSQAGNDKAPALNDWHYATEQTWIEGTDDRYAMIDGPSPLESLGVHQGYAWAKVTFDQPAATRARHAVPDIADRAHVFVDGANSTLLGDGPGIEAIAGVITPLNIKKGKRTITMLLDNLGRSARADGDERKGIWGHIHEIKPLKATSQVSEADGLDLLEHRNPIFGLHAGTLTNAYRGCWEFTHRKKAPILLITEELEWTGAVLVNDEVVRVFVPGDTIRLTLDEAILKRGKNKVEIAFVGTDDHVEEAWATLSQRASLYESARVVTAKGKWALGSWVQPRPAHLTPMKKAALTAAGSRGYKGAPTWFRASFSGAPSRGLYINTNGLTKGQLFINGKNLGRYFNATPDGKQLPVQAPLWIPGPWLNDEENELFIFDEHGYPPGKVKLQRV